MMVLYLFNGPLFSFFLQNTNFTERKLFVDFNTIRIRIVGVEGEHVGHSTTAATVLYEQFHCSNVNEKKHVHTYMNDMFIERSILPT